MKSWLSVLFIFISFSTFAQNLPLTTADIFSSPYLTGTRPASPVLSPDGKWVVYQWNAQGYDTLYLFLTNTITRKTNQISKQKQTRFQNWRSDSNSFLFIENGEIWSYSTETGISEVITATEGTITSLSEGEDLSSLSFLTRNTVSTIQKGSPLFITKKPADGQTQISFTGRLAKTGNLILQLTQTDSLIENPVPQWLNPILEVQQSARSGWYKFRFVQMSPDSVKPKTPGGENWTAGYGGSTAISRDGRWLAWSNIRMDQKSRDFMICDLQSGKTDTFFTQTDTAWINPFDGFGFSPDSKTLAFTHEMTGWNHVYLYDLQSKSIKQMTSGKYEVDFFIWNPGNKDELFLTSTETSPFNRQIWKLNIRTGERKSLTETDGVRTEISVSSDGKTLSYLKTSLSEPSDIWLLDVKTLKETQLTHSVPPRFSSFKKTLPEIKWIKNRETNTEFPAQVFLPDQYSPDKTYPAVIFVHGAGYLQNVLNHYGYYWRENLFNQYLAQQGYIVLNIDYSGSAGYGRDVRISIYKDMGGADWSDCVAAARYLTQTGLADSSRIGIYGGSYGGFLTLMGLFKSPDVFKAGAALRSVANWELYNRWYTEQRLGSLKQNKAIYEKTSPVTYASGLKNHLLVLHGMVDDNVLFQDVVQLSQKLIELNKKFDVMYYPAESHGFKDQKAWRHQYEEIENHFNQFLKEKL
ncbi:MAG: prolyl oligopeptidase family serine peptidase [Bacteroidetes bacterium]|nr:prolyl oligopeptidase family serine peptidase [Bacteroidota bacterium]